MKTNRRSFLKTAGLGALAGMVPYTITTAKAQEMKNDRPNVGIIGCGGKGGHDAILASKYGDIVAMADVNELRFDGLRKHPAINCREDVGLYRDYRELLDRKDVDVVIQATTDHWHTKINADTLRSGRDLYAEKPFALTIEEGKFMRGVVENSGRVFQLGTQQRSGDQYEGGKHPRPFQELVEIVRNGRIGALKQVWVSIPYLSMKGGPFAEEPIPDTLDWDRFQGQSPVRPYTKYRVHPFRGWFDYCGSMAADWGNHHYDIAHWGMDTELTGPTDIVCRGIWPNEGREGCFDVPDQFFARLQYKCGVEVLFFTGMNMRENYGWPVEPHIDLTPEKKDWLFGPDVPDEVKTYTRNGVMFIGEKGRVFANRGGVYGKAAEELADNPIPADGWHAPASRDHMENFFDCVKSRGTPVTSAAVGHRSLTPCQLSVISMRLGGRPLQWDPEKEEIVGDAEATALMSREQRKPYEIS